MTNEEIVAEALKRANDRAAADAVGAVQNCLFNISSHLKSIADLNKQIAAKQVLINEEKTKIKLVSYVEITADELEPDVVTS